MLARTYRKLGATYLRLIDSAPGPVNTNSAKMKLYSAALSPPLSMGQNASGKCIQKYATAIIPEATNAAAYRLLRSLLQAA